MSTKITNFYLMNLIYTFISSLEFNADWKPSTRFLEGTRVRSGNYVYLALNTGTTSTVAPVHASGSANDGGVTWAFVGSAQIPSGNIGSNLYLGLGGPASWKNEPTPDEVGDPQESLRLAKTFLKLNRRNVSAGVQRLDWTSRVIPQWPSEDSYVNVGARVYRCLSNNNGAASTVEPTATPMTLFELNDGYVWKYLGDIGAAADIQFGTPTAFAISPLNVNDGSDRWNIQESARDGSISGFGHATSIGQFNDPVTLVLGPGTGGAARADVNGQGELTRIIPTGVGQNYDNSSVVVVREDGAPGQGATGTLTLSGGAITAAAVASQGTGYTDAVAIVEGDGTGATVEVVVTSGYVTGLTVTSAGSGYTRARLFIIAGTSGAVAPVVMAPVGGHGRDMSKELPVNYLLVNRRITGFDAGYVPTEEFRQLTLVTAIRNTTGTGDLLVGPNHPAPGSLDKAVISDARVLFLSNVGAIEHETGQDEELKLSLKLA